MVRLDALLTCAAVLCLGCSSKSATTTNTATTAPVDVAPSATTASIVLLGDVMLGRSVAPVAANDRDSIFEPIRATLSGADLTLGNLESPLT